MAVKSMMMNGTMRSEDMARAKREPLASPISPRAAAKRGGHAPPYEDMLPDQLPDRAKRIGIEGLLGMTKKEPIHALQYH